MSTESPAEPKPRGSSVRRQSVPKSSVPEADSGTARLIDGTLLLLFLALTFLLGVFPLKDTDFWWHLRTGDWIRAQGTVPRTDLYLFTREGTPWIDLHWLFQVGISWIFERGGIPWLNLAKCGITVAAVFLLVTTRRRDWPLWVILLAWIPALLVLGGRMYVRPETLSLLYLSVYLAILARWDGMPRLAWILPLVQVVWVNSHGLFVLGPIVLGFALVSEAISPRHRMPDRLRWWRIVLPAAGAVGLACLVNPYGITGALYPLELAGTMRNPIFSKNIAELTPIADFIKQSGIRNLPLLLHFATIGVGALSFLIPILWMVAVRIKDGSEPGRAGKSISELATDTERKANLPGSRSTKNAKKSGLSRKRDDSRDTSLSWSISPFRLLLFVAFCALSMQATRNSHQFAAVVGTVTAWNFGEWAGAMARRREARRLAGAGAKSTRARGDGGDPQVREDSRWLAARLVTLAVLALLFVAVAGGWFYELAGEGRTVGLGEEPLWYPHQAAKVVGEPGMPDRYLTFHIGHASLLEYEHGPEHKLFADARLEVLGADLFARYLGLQRELSYNQGGWESRLDTMGRPAILADHEYNALVGASLLQSTRWRCVWFDPIAAVFVHDSYSDAVRAHEVDFNARHFRFRPDAKTEPHGLAELLAASRGIRNYLSGISPARRDLSNGLIGLSYDYARRIFQIVPDSLETWKIVGQVELLRTLSEEVGPRFRMEFDPVHDLSLVRSTAALKRALEAAPGDFMSLLALSRSYKLRGMIEAERPLLERMIDLYPKNEQQAAEQLEAAKRLRAIGGARPEREPTPSWKNLSELEQAVESLLEEGRAESAAAMLEGASPMGRASWETLDRIATIRLHMGETERARSVWQAAEDVQPQPGVCSARIAVTYLADCDFESARRHFEEAIKADPELFEARYGLAVLEQDAGRAGPALQQARKAGEIAPDEIARAESRAIAAAVSRYARLIDSVSGAGASKPSSR
jgi:tetratricopeptide (TPR) repeat protein